MADTSVCIRCREGKYKPLDEETDFQGRVFTLLECDKCQSLVIRKKGWDPESWAKTAE
jgi:hypothetical protein